MVIAHLLNAPTKVSLHKMVSVKIVEIIFVLIMIIPNAYKVYVLVFKII
jgi:hypothetical protein